MQNGGFVTLKDRKEGSSPMAAPVLDLVLPALSETSANLIGQRLRQRMSHLHPHIESTVSFVPAAGQYKAPRIKLSWRELVALIGSLARERGRRGQQPFAVETLLRIYFMR